MMYVRMLVAAARHWDDPGASRRRPPGLPHNTALRRRLLELSARIWWHPFFTASGGRAPAARVELRCLACERG